MKAIIEPGAISGNIIAPPSKSMAQRAYAAALLHSGKTIITNAGSSDDEKAALGVILSLGAKVSIQGAITIITSEGIDGHTGVLHHTADRIDCGESGLCARLFIPIAALSDRAITINGNGSLLKRPMTGIENTLSQLGVKVTTTAGCLPITLNGKLAPEYIKIDGSHGSQFLSGLLFAYCYAQDQPMHVIEVHGLKSRPYVDMTIDMLRLFGNDVQQEQHRIFYIGNDSQNFNGREIEVVIDGDWSSAAYLLVAGALAGNVTVTNLNLNSRQADRAIIDILKIAGAEMIISQDSITVKSSFLQPFDFDATHCPDLFPVLAILAACCNGDSSIRGVHRLFNKESNRVESIADMLWDFQVPFSMEDDTLSITGEGYFQGTCIDSHQDHRIVMASAIGALRANGPVEISHAGSVNKSYPGFFDDLILCGAACTFIND